MLHGYGDYKYELVDNWAKPRGIESFIDVVSVMVDSDDRVYVLNRSEYPMIVFDCSGSQLFAWGKGLFQRPHGGCLGSDGLIYIADDYANVVHRFSPEGELISTIGNVGKPSDSGFRPGLDVFERISSIERGAPPFNQPTGVAVSRSGDIFVSDGYGNARVHRFNAQGELLLSWGEPGGGQGQFRLPHGVWVDSSDRVWVADRENNRLQLFDSGGAFLEQWQDVIRPTHVFIDSSNTVYVAELCRRISIFSISGTLLARWGNESHSTECPLLVGPHCVAVDSRGDLYVGEVARTMGKVDRGSNAILKFSRTL